MGCGSGLLGLTIQLGSPEGAAFSLQVHAAPICLETVNYYLLSLYISIFCLVQWATHGYLLWTATEGSCTQNYY